MNEKRTIAFNEWWLLKATPEGRMTPSSIWDAACDWMKAEMENRIEKFLESTHDEQS